MGRNWSFVIKKQATITVKIDAEVKEDAQLLAKRIGLTLTSIIENQLRVVVREERVVFGAGVVPSRERLRAYIKGHLPSAS